MATKFDVAPLPGPSALGGWNLGISSCSTHQQTARDFIRFATTEANQRKLFETAGFAPTIAALYHDPALLGRFPYLDVIRRSVASSRNRPATPYYENVSDLVQEYLANALSNPVSADAMTARLAERLGAIAQGR